MKINLTEIYKGLDEWRAERKITAESQRQGYLRNIMEELGELAAGLRDYEKIKNGEQVIKKHIAKEWNENNTKWAALGYKKVTLADAEYQIIDALCDISVFTINAGEHIPCALKHTEIEWEKSSLDADYILKQMVEKCALFSYFDWGETSAFNIILINCAYLCEHYGFNFEIAMLETIKEISSRTGSYDETAKKWIKDTSDEARAKWYQADYEKARIK